MILFFCNERCGRAVGLAETGFGEEANAVSENENPDYLDR